MAKTKLETFYRRQNFYMDVWRIGHALWQMQVPVLPEAVRILCRIVFHADMPAQVAVPPDVIFVHNGMGVVVHTQVRFRGPALIFHNVTIGNSKGFRDGVPVIGSHVMIGAGAVIMGPITIGDGCVIGANAVVTRDVPPYHMAMGNPAQLKPCDPELIRHLFLGDEPESAPSTASAMDALRSTNGAAALET